MQLLVNLDVPDLARAEAVYCRAFGLRPARRFGESVVELAGGPVLIHLLHKPEGSIGAAGQTRVYGRHWMPAHLDVVVEDLDSALARAEASGFTREGDVRTASWGRIVQLADPFGHGWCLIQFLGRGYDEIAGT